MNSFVENWWYFTSVALGATTLAWTWRERVAADSRTAPRSFAVGRVNKCKLDEYDAASITANEVKKLLDTPDYLAWFGQHSRRLHAQHEAVARRSQWLNFMLIFVAAYACFTLPFSAFDADEPTLNATFTALPQIRMGVASMSLLVTLVAFAGEGAAYKSLLVAAFVVTVAVANSARLGFGFCLLFATVAIKALLL